MYDHRLQINYEIHSGWMIFGIWVYNNELPIKFEFRSGTDLKQ